MDKILYMIVPLALATFAIRVSGVILGQRLPQTGFWARALQALPGCLIISLVAVSLLAGGPNEWIAGAVAAVVAIVSRNLVVTMGIAIAAIWFLRSGLIY